MKSGFAHLALLSLVLAVFASSCVFSQKTRKPIDSVKSPSGDYELTFWRENDGAVQYVTLTTKRRDKEIKIANPLYYEIDYDGEKAGPFENAYPDKDWISSRIMRLGNADDRAQTSNFVIIKNDSGKDVQQAVVHANATFIIYDLKASETVNIPVKWSERSPDSLLGVTAEISFADGGSIPVKAEVFQPSSNSDDRNFEISIGENKVSIQRWQTPPK